MKRILAAVILAGCATASPKPIDPTPATVRTVGDFLLTFCNEDEDAQSCASLALGYEREGDHAKAKKYWDRACALGDVPSCSRR